MLEPGATVESFTLSDHTDTPVRWDDFRGAPVAVFFYPKASTPGCTTEACAFRDLTPEFDAIGVKLIGMSADSVKRQSNFSTKYELTMPLLSDPDRVVLNAWGVWGQKQMYGKTYEGIIRSTFLFDADGVVHKAWPKVRVKGHAEDVLEAAKALAT
ncbi:MAG: thioredoxin-dependent thiol peroxidase [Myxococcota bacterium]